MVSTIFPLIRPSLILNADMTQFKTGGVQTANIEVVCDLAYKNSYKTKPKKNGALVAFYVKYYLLCAAPGIAANPIFILQNDKMKDADFDVHEIEYFGSTTDINAKGYIVFVQSRGKLPEEFYIWFYKEILIPFVKNIRSKLHDDDNERRGVSAYFQLDGERAQIDAAFKCVDIFNHNSIILGKSNHSRTEVEQPCDNSNCFKGPKTALNAINKKDVSKNFFVPIIKDIIKKHEESYSKLPALHATYAAYGLIKVRMALLKSLNAENISEGFVNCYGKSPFDINTILDNCTTPIPPEERLRYVETVLPHLIQEMKTKGRITDEIMNRYHICSNDEAVQFNNKSVSNQRAVVLTNMNYIANERRLQDIRETKKEVAATTKMARSLKKRKREQKVESNDEVDEDCHHVDEEAFETLKVKSSSRRKALKIN
jgi:hypothetical protein